MQNKPHPHKASIIAWANGAEIEVSCLTADDWYPVDEPKWYPDMKYRIKPTPPKAEWIYCDGKRPEGIPDGTMVIWYGEKYLNLDTHVKIKDIDFTGDGMNPIQFIKIVEDKDAE